MPARRRAALQGGESKESKDNYSESKVIDGKRSPQQLGRRKRGGPIEFNADKIQEVSKAAERIGQERDEEDVEDDFDTEEEEDSICAFPLTAFGSNARENLGLGPNNGKLFISRPSAVQSIEKTFRIGSVASRLETTLVSHQTTGALYTCSRDTKGSFEKLDTKGAFVLEVAMTSSTKFLVTGKRLVYSWGSNKYGQLGRPLTEGEQAKKRAEEEAGEERISSASLLVGGSKKKSPLAVNTPNESARARIRRQTVLKNQGIPFDCGVVAKLASFRVSQLATGRFHVIVLTTAGVVYSWGRNNSGQLGLGDLKDRDIPCSVDFLNGCKVHYVAAGEEQSACCGDTSLGRHLNKTINLKHKTRVVFSWGNAENNRLGHGRYDGDKYFWGATDDDDQNEDDDHVRPGSRGGGRRRSSIARRKSSLGSRHGSSRQMQSGDSKLAAARNEDESKKVEVAHLPKDRKVCSSPCCIPALIGSATNIVNKIAIGDAHGVALFNTGQCATWGDNMYGQLGLGHTYSEAEPVRIESLSNIALIAAGRQHTLFVTSSGIVYSCGFNHYGELGLGDTDVRISPTPLVWLKDEGVRPTGLCCGPTLTLLWARVEAEDSALCFQHSLKALLMRLSNGTGNGDPLVAPMTVTRDGESDGYSYLALAGPSVGSGQQTWLVQVDKISSDDLPLGIGVGSSEDMDPFMFDVFEQGVSWLYMSNGDKQHFSDSEQYAEQYYEKDVIGVHLDVDLGSLRFSRRGKDLGLCYYLSCNKPLYLVVSLADDNDQVTLLPPEKEEESALIDPGTQVCFNDEGLSKTTGVEVFYECGPCKLSICRACARHCEHRQHCTSLIINHDPVRQHCECDDITCQCKKLN